MYQDLVLYIIPLLERIKYGLILRNPILKEVENDVLAFDIATSAGEVKTEYGKNLNKDEFAYLALSL